MVMQIPLSRGMTAQVDDEDFDVVMAVGPWYATVKKQTWYATHDVRKADGRRTMQALHRLLRPDWRLIDHINGDGLDNRRANLRLATFAQNGANRRMSRRNTTGFKGVFWDPERKLWRAAITYERRHHHVGRFATAEQAARAYDARALELFGEFARPNFPQETS